jgi:hypothetical protein
VLQPIRGRKAIILLSDGNDHGSVVTLKNCSGRVEADAMIYSIYYLPEAMRFWDLPRPMRFPSATL